MRFIILKKSSPLSFQAFLYCKKTVQFINQVYFHFTDLPSEVSISSSTTTFDRTEHVDLFLVFFKLSEHRIVLSFPEKERKRESVKI